MTQRRSRRIAVAVALATVLALAAPAHAAGRHAWAAGPAWIEEAVQWLARWWPGNAAERDQKAGVGIDPNGSPAPAPNPGTGTNGVAAPPAMDPALDRGHGIDPDG